jgi:hypothetical protein
MIVLVVVVALGLGFKSRRDSVNEAYNERKGMHVEK